MISKKVVFLPYDFDTAIGINNEGALVFSYNLEDTDHLESGADVFNGQQSVLWNNLRDAFGGDIKSMYQTLRSTGALSYDKVERMFEEHQAKWGEAIFNEDAYFKYLAPLIDDGSGAYLSMLQGSKAEQRKWWLYNRFRYLDSKYNAGDALSDVIQLRGYAKANVTVTPYADVYASVKFGSYLQQVRAARNVPVTLTCPLDTVNDTEIYIYSSSQLASVGDLSGLKVGFADFSLATKIQSIKLGDSGASYDNGNLKELYLGNNVLLRSLDVRNCSGLGTGDMKSVDISGCKNIEQVYFDGTQITGINLPVGGILKKLHLPSTITNLTIRNQPSITEFVIPSYSSISTLWLDNVSSAVDEKAILRAIPANSRVRLANIRWEATDAAEIDGLYDILDTMRGLDEYGNNMDRAQISGSIHTNSLTGAEIAEFNSRYPYVSVTADHTTSYRTYADYDGTVLKKVTCIDGVPQESAPSNPSRSSTAQYSFTFVGWSKSMDAQTADSDALENVQSDRTVYAAYSRTVRTYTVTWKNSNGTVLETDNNVPYGTTPQYNGSTPQNPTSGGGAFQGWSPSISPVTGNVTYTASYIVTYTVYFYNGSTLLQTVTGVTSGGSATYTGETPVDATNGYDFSRWSPQPTNITANTSCYAQFTPPWEVAEISDGWETILANVSNGTYASKYKPGNYKPLDLGAEGIVNMQIVAMNADALASGGGTAPITWISKELLATDHRMNPDRAGESGNYTEGTGAIGGWDKSEMRTYLRETIKPLIPSAVRSAIVEVTKYSRSYNTAGTLVNDVTTTDDVWIPSYREMFGNGETQGPAYSSAFPDAASRVKYKTGAASASVWWLRSAYYTNSNYFSYVYTSGSDSVSYANNSRGITLGFCT
jgi:hypothetical protein